MRRNRSIRVLPALVLSLAAAGAIHAGDRLLGTGGVTNLEGSGGGGLTPWALIAGLGTADEVGGSAWCTRVAPGGFALDSCGVGLGFYDRTEVSFARQHFSLGRTVPGATIEQTIVGVKLRLRGDAVIDQDSPWPQLALGALWKHNEDFGFVPRLLGAKHADGTDLYLAATRIWLAGAFGRTWLADATLRATEANQLGLLGFGGDRGGYRLVGEGSVGVFLGERLLLGAEYRQKPDNLAAFREQAFADSFLAWWPTKEWSVTLAYTWLGNIADRSNRQGAYVSLETNW